MLLWLKSSFFSNRAIAEYSVDLDYVPLSWTQMNDGLVRDVGNRFIFELRLDLQPLLLIFWSDFVWEELTLQ